MAGGPALGSSQARYGVRSATSDTSRATLGGAPLSDTAANAQSSRSTTTTAVSAAAAAARPVRRKYLFCSDISPQSKNVFHKSKNNNIILLLVFSVAHSD